MPTKEEIFPKSIKCLGSVQEYSFVSFPSQYHHQPLNEISKIFEFISKNNKFVEHPPHRKTILNDEHYTMLMDLLDPLDKINVSLDNKYLECL